MDRQSIGGSLDVNKYRSMSDTTGARVQSTRGVDVERIIEDVKLTVIIDDAKLTVRSMLGKIGGGIMPNIIRIVKLMIEYIDANQVLSGKEKKEFVIQIIHDIIDEDDGYMDAFDGVIKPIISSAIDELILVGKNGLRFAPKARGHKSSFSCCMGYASKIFVKSLS
jgi:hypothetical protein